MKPYNLITFHFVLGLLCTLLSTSVVVGQSSPGKAARNYETLSEDGAWCWFSDPRAVSVDDKIITGWVARDGSVMVASYDIKSKAVQQFNLYPQFNKDDHANPSFVVLPDKKIMAFFSAHSTKGRGEKEPAISYAITKESGDITSWEPLQRITENSEGPMAFCYTNPVLLSEESNRIYVFWRGGDWKPTFRYTDDRGKSWSNIFSLVKSSENVFKRPYVKVSSNGKDEIHFAFTDGHPRNEPLNSIYYLKYRKGKFFKADGTELGTTQDLPLNHEDCDLVYDASEHFKKNAFGVRSWIWDIAVDSIGNPVIAYTKLPTESEHQYWYAYWDGQRWLNSKISDAGSWFPRYVKSKSEQEPEPHYSGGISLDQHEPNVVYFSKPVGDIFEVFRSETTDQGKSWVETPLTANSRKDNVRPHVIRRTAKAPGQVTWMYNDRYSEYTDFDTGIKISVEKDAFDPKLSEEEVRTVMKAVADWQVGEPLRHELGDWTNAALYAGMVQWAKIAEDSVYFDYLRDKGNSIQWARLTRTNPDYRYHADDYATGQMFVEMYRVFGEEKMIKPTATYLDFILKHPSTRNLVFDWQPGSFPTERWSWCDALFMGPPVWAKMANELGRQDYLDFMHKEYTDTYDYLYDQEEHLFFRDDRYFGKKEANGEKVFWGRGNGWVIAGLPTILSEVPDDWNEKRFYEKLFVEMAEKVASLQDAEGYWHASLLDPASYPNPETSSSAFFTYALAWGVNNGYLKKKKFQPVVDKGWRALVRAVYPDGKLGWVQPVGQDPRNVTQDMTEVYGVGAFLLAGTEILKMVR